MSAPSKSTLAGPAQQLAESKGTRAETLSRRGTTNGSLTRKKAARRRKAKDCRRKMGIRASSNPDRHFSPAIFCHLNGVPLKCGFCFANAAGLGILK
jgi:hypothetical protein